MMERVTFKLPSTLNALEFFDGSGNRETSRRNEFIPSLMHVAVIMIRKRLSFDNVMQDSFGVMINKA
jgi:hypothetical protein